MKMLALRRAARGIIAAVPPRRAPIFTVAPRAIEPLEPRRMLATILWTNEFGANGFGSEYGANESVARGIVNRAITDWENVIVDFNYDDTGPDLGNTFSLEIDAAAIGGRGLTRNISRDDDIDRKPVSAEIVMDDDGGGGGWYFDSLVGADGVPDDGEYTNILSLFAANSPTGTGNDFYRTIAHEIGHAMGILDAGGGFLRLGDFQTYVESDPNGGTLINIDLPGGTANDYTLTTSGGGHLWEGDGPGGNTRREHPNDLLNSGRTVGTGINRRQLISDDNALLLRDAYNYTINLPSQINTFATNLNRATNVVTVTGDLSLGVSDVDAVTVVVDGADTQFEVSGAFESIASAEFAALAINSGSAADLVIIYSLPPRKAVAVNAGAGDDAVDILQGSAGESILIDGGSGFDDVLLGGSTVARFASSQDLGILSLAGPSSLTIDEGSDATIEVRDTFLLSAGGALLDVADNSLIVRAAAGGGNLANFRARIAAAHNGGAWNGPSGITSSTARISAVGDGVGYGTSTQIARATFNGIAIAGNDLVIDYTLYGDADLSRTVNLADFNRQRGNFGQSGNESWAEGDFDYNGNVNLADFNRLRANFGQSLDGGNLFGGDGDDDEDDVKQA